MALHQKGKGYQGLQSKLAKINSPFGSDAIRESIYCSYPDKTNYLIAIKTLPQIQARIVVTDFKLTEGDGSADAIQVEAPLIAEYNLWKETASDHYLTHIFPLKKEKCFLAIVYASICSELWKIEIESGNILWKKTTTSQSFVEDDRGILFCLSHLGHIVLLDSATGLVLSQLKNRYERFYGIGLDLNENLMLGGYSRNYLMEIKVVTKNGKFVKKLDGIYNDFSCQVDPFMKLTYIVQRSQFTLHSCDTDYDISRINHFEHPIFGFFFVKDFKYLVICDADTLYVYD